MAVRLRVSFSAMFMVAAMVIGMNAAHAAQIKVMAANAVKEAYIDIVSAFEKSSGHRVTTIWGGTEGITKRISGGEVVDIVIIAAPNIDKLILEGKLVKGSRTDFARSGIGIAVRTGLPKPDISSADAVKRAVLAAKSVAYSSGPSGFYLADLLSKSWVLPIRSRARYGSPPPVFKWASWWRAGRLISASSRSANFCTSKASTISGPCQPRSKT
jgi:ABC-type molybdate transport system substrate-binding protein